MCVCLQDTEFFCVYQFDFVECETEYLKAKSHLISVSAVLLCYINISVFTQVHAALTM